MTQKWLSALTGISQGDFSKIENGNANPSVHKKNSYCIE